MSTALGEGYRRFDTAAMYRNEVGVGRAIGGAIGDANEANLGTGGSGESVHALTREGAEDLEAGHMDRHVTRFEGGA